MANKALGYGLMAAGAILPPLYGAYSQHRQQKQANEALDPIISGFRQQVGAVDSSDIMEQEIEPNLSQSSQQAMQSLQDDPMRLGTELKSMLLKAHLAAADKGLDQEVVMQKLKPYHELFKFVGLEAEKKWQTLSQQPGAFVLPSGQEAPEGATMTAEHGGMRAYQPPNVSQYMEQSGVPEITREMGDEELQDARAQHAHMTRATLAGLPFESSPSEVDRQVREGMSKWPERPRVGTGQYDLTDPRAGHAMLRHMQDFPSLGGSQALQAQMQQMAVRGEGTGPVMPTIDEALEELKRVQGMLPEGQTAGLSATPNGYIVNVGPTPDTRDTPIAREERKVYREDQDAMAEQVASINALIANPDSLDQDQFMLAQRFSGADGEFDPGRAEAEAVRLRKQLLDSYNAHGGEILYPGDPAGAARGYDMLTRKLGGAPSGYEDYRPSGRQPATTVPQMPGAPGVGPQPSADAMTGLGGDVESQVAAFSSQALGRPVEPAAGGEAQPAVPQMPEGVNVQQDAQLMQQAATIVPELRTLIDSVRKAPSLQNEQVIREVMGILRQMSSSGAANPEAISQAVRQVLRQHPNLFPPEAAGTWSEGGMFGDWRGAETTPGTLPVPGGGDSLRGALHPSKIQPMLQGMVGTGEAPVTAPSAFLERLRQIEQQQGR